MNFTDNPELVRAALLGQQVNERRAARFDENISVVVARCSCGWFDYFRTLEQSPPNCPRCNATIPVVDLS